MEFSREDTSLVILFFTALDDRLESALIATMRPTMTKKKQKEIFGAYGPLGTAAAKIDIAYAFEVIDEPTYKDLHTLKAIRNKFAHPKGIVNFRSEDVISRCKQLTTWHDDVDVDDVFRKAVLKCLGALQSRIDPTGKAQALKAAPPA